MLVNTGSDLTFCYAEMTRPGMNSYDAQKCKKDSHYS